jgi:hypothetical protein
MLRSNDSREAEVANLELGMEDHTQPEEQAGRQHSSREDATHAHKLSANALAFSTSLSPCWTRERAELIKGLRVKG